MSTKMKLIVIVIITIIFTVLLFCRFHKSTFPADAIHCYNKLVSDDEISFDCTMITSYDLYADHSIRYKDQSAYIMVYCYTVPIFNKGRNGMFHIAIDRTKHDVKKVYFIDNKNRTEELELDL